MPAPRLSKYLQGIYCFACGTSHDPLSLLGVCERCGMPLRVDYDLALDPADLVVGSACDLVAVPRAVAAELPSREEEEMQQATADLAARSGIDVCPEFGAAWAALSRSRERLHTLDR